MLSTRVFMIHNHGNPHFSDMKTFFLHGLESSGQGTKGKYLTTLFPDIIAPDFEGSLEKRLQKFTQLIEQDDELILVGSSYGGLMATCFALQNESAVHRLVLMAPALNFPGLIPPERKIATPTYILIGSLDDVTPPEIVLPVAQQIFSNLEKKIVEEDHLLHRAFHQLDWPTLLLKSDSDVI